MVFESTLVDLVTGIRSHKRDTALFISSSIADIKVELSSSDFFTKANALQKLTFLQMMGYSMSYAVFGAVEVMSSTRFGLKRVGVLGICQGLDSPDKSPVVLLTTNLLKKELRGAGGNAVGESVYHAGLAINCLSNIVTEDLGRETLPDLLHLLKHPSPYVRKKALLCLYKVFLKYPRGLRLSYDAIKSCLDDAHPSVVSCAVNVITELSDKNPKNYLPLAPAFFRLLTSSANNWMLIKVVKLLGSLVPEEPRLARKLLEPLSGIVKSTHAKSLLYEAVFAITLCLQHVNQGKRELDVSEVVELCVTTLRSFVSDPDQNLKYLGLVGFGSLLHSQPRVLHTQKGSDCRGLILKCLSDDDVTIRTRALGLLRFMTTQRNLVDLITQLLGHVEAASGEYRSDLVSDIVHMCSSDKYDLVTDFAWYFDVLLILAGVRGVEGGHVSETIAKQWMDVAWRVLPVRSYAVRRSLEVLVCRGNLDVNVGSHVILEVLPAAAWIVGEYSHLLPEALTNNDDVGDEGKTDPRYDASSRGAYHALIQSMTSPTDAAGMNPLPLSTQAVFVQNAVKVFAAACECNLRTTSANNSIKLDNNELQCTDDELYACANTLMENLAVYCESVNVEVQERAFTLRQLLLAIDIPSDFSVSTDTASMIASKCRTASTMLTYLLTPEPMKPLSAKAQQRKLMEGPPSPVSMEEWECDVDWSVFPFLTEETSWFDREGNARGSVESISFTKQQQQQATNNVTTAISSSNRVTTGDNMPSFGDIDAVSNGAFDTGVRTKQRVGDPFYLSGPSTGPTGRLLDATGNLGVSGMISDVDREASDAAAVAATRFGSIRLDSGDEESDDGYDASRGSGTKSRKKKKKKASTTRAMKVQQIVHESDEDDDDAKARQQLQRGVSGVSKEFHNLAMVDLTTPLGEDEVMPRNEHYVVPERSQPPVEQSSSLALSKKKKDKSSKKKIKKSHQESSAMVEGDLLGFDPLAFTSVPSAESNYVDSVPSPSGRKHPINNAFDDLLGLEMPQSSELGSLNAGMEQKPVPIPDVRTLQEKKQKKEKKSKKEKKKSS